MTTPPARTKRYVSSWNLISFAIGLIILFVLLRKVDFAALMQLIYTMKPEYLLLGGVVYLCKALVRSLRIYRLNQRDNPGYFQMLRLSLANSLASAILPLKLGELSYVYLLRKDNRSSISQGLSSLMVLRIFDLLAISLLFTLISVVVRLPENLSVFFYSILAFMGLLLAFIVGLLVASRHSQTILHWIFRLKQVQKIPLAQKIRGGLEGIFTELNQYQPRQYTEWAFLASLEWLVNYGAFHVLMIGLGFSPSLFATVTAVTFAALASVLPVNSFGNFGTQEAGWATGLVLLGFSQNISLSSGFATHLLTLGYMICFGGTAWLTYLFGTGQAAPRPAGQPGEPK